jgi:hypothetical protein
VFPIEVVKMLRLLLQGVAPLMNNMGFVEFHSCRAAQGHNGSSMIRVGWFYRIRTNSAR